jgi:hypothetical protein
MKEETLEEAAKKYAESNQYGLEYYNEGGYQGIEVEFFAEKLVDFTTRWQAERRYNEEDMCLLVAEYQEYLKRTFHPEFSQATFKQWFEQHKKK